MKNRALVRAYIKAGMKEANPNLTDNARKKARKYQKEVWAELRQRRIHFYKKTLVDLAVDTLSKKELEDFNPKLPKIEYLLKIWNLNCADVRQV